MKNLSEYVNESINGTVNEGKDFAKILKGGGNWTEKDWYLCDMSPEGDEFDERAAIKLLRTLLLEVSGGKFTKKMANNLYYDRKDLVFGDEAIIKFKNDFEHDDAWSARLVVPVILGMFGLQVAPEYQEYFEKDWQSLANERNYDYIMPKADMDKYMKTEFV